MENKLENKLENLPDPGLEITSKDIKNHFCPLATEKETFLALGILKSLNLNPFKREVHLIKYDATKPLTLVVGYDVYLKRAERTGKLDGWEVGISVDKKTAWIKIYRKDWKIPLHWEVNLSEFSKNQATWKQIPDFMGKKVAIAQGFRLAFPDELGGMPYTPEEQEVFDISPSKEPIKMPQEKTTPAPKKQSIPVNEKSAFETMLGSFAQAKKVLGEEMYYEFLGGAGFEHANEITSISDGEHILALMRKEAVQLKSGAK